MDIRSNLQTTGQAEAEKKKDLGTLLLSCVLFVLELVAILLIVFFIIRLFVLQPFTVVGSSMYDTLVDGQEVYANILSYRFKDPMRGDIVVLVPPQQTDRYLVKRIIGLPGDRLEIKGDGQVIIYNNQYPNGIALREEYLDTPASTQGYVVERLGSDEYFVMGDNRTHSSDSRGDVVSDNTGPLTAWTLPKRNIVGRVIARVKPFSEFALFPSPHYNL
ncbi:signal peptidase I [Candidatus Wirthbacteria bacterium CG2_30_54_11]|uniref:Signal peptidase I n=1 Tax=Candidatus Wirthbacteria bacterium CG2_30_54_11 TaxID=1817892 RepID=A0A1J5IBJ2_9BACT|nr:MAG: signal peptidase I [Candidatus Wirthbacteria bacterium CG2_30_54_11]